MILGIDEVGRGPWAGPLVVGAVVLAGTEIDGLDDSKKLTKKRREALEPIIYERAAACALGWVGADELDNIGMSAALKLATIRAVEQIHVPYHEIIIDGTINLLAETNKGKYVITMPKADGIVPSVSAASIIAKVARDRFMAEQDEVYPGYDFGKHAGYGVAAHRAAIERLGVTTLHRLSFAPLAKYRTDESAKVVANEAVTPAVTTRGIGNDSEAAAATYLINNGHSIIERNWKTKMCEIDIVSTKNGVMYFTEVKHRKTATRGDGFDAITKTKLGQMEFAAKLYATHDKAKGLELRLAVAKTTGTPPTVVDFLEIL